MRILRRLDKFVCENCSGSARCGPAVRWRVPRSAGEAAQWIRAYLRRWSVEDSGRACKQLVGIEDVRVQSLRAIVRLVRLAGMALGWLCLLVLFAPRTVAEILGRAKTVGREPLFLAYRLLEGIRHPA